MAHIRWVRAVLGFGVTLLPVVASAQTALTGKEAAEAAVATRGRLGGSLTFSNDVGIGTFVRNGYSDDPYFAQSLRLLPTYGLFKNVSVQADETISWEWTSPSDASAGPAGRHWALSDMVFRIRHSSLYRDQRLTGINLSGAFSAALPLSHESRWRDTITRLTATVGLDRTFFDRLSFNYIFGATKYVSTTTTRGYTVTDQGSVTDDQGNYLVLCSPSDETCAGTTGVNYNFAFRNEVGASYRFTDRFSAGMSLRFTTYLKYKVGDASQPEQNATYDNRHTETWTLGDISGSYDINDRYSVSAGITSEQLQSDSRGSPRFPWFDFETSSNNYTTVYVSGTATF